MSIAICAWAKSLREKSPFFVVMPLTLALRLSSECDPEVVQKQKACAKHSCTMACKSQAWQAWCCF